LKNISIFSILIIEKTGVSNTVNNPCEYEHQLLIAEWDSISGNKFFNLSIFANFNLEIINKLLAQALYMLLM